MATTNGRDHLAELWEAVGAQNPGTSFSRENGAEQLERHFASVRRHDIETRAVFSDRPAAASYLATLERSDLAERLPELPEPLIARGTPTVFVAHEPRAGTP